MKTLWSLTKRNMLIYFKDKSAVFFSLLSALIVIGLYAVFLADTNINAVEALISTDRQSIAYLVNCWVMAGIIVVNTVTVTLGVLGNMIEDEAENRLASFLVSPLSRTKIVLGYILSAFIVGNILCVGSFILSQLYIIETGGSLLKWDQTLKILGLIGVSIFSATSSVFFIVTFVRSRNAFALISTIIGTLIGFVAGVYIPVGVLAKPVQNFIECIPVFYSASLIREIFMADPIAIVFKGAPESVVANYLRKMGVIIHWNDVLVSNQIKIAIIFVSGAFFLVLSVIMMRQKKLLK
jgi:multidrug/hemolysin transport system permease protein